MSIDSKRQKASIIVILIITIFVEPSFLAIPHTPHLLPFSLWLERKRNGEESSPDGIEHQPNELDLPFSARPPHHEALYLLPPHLRRLFHPEHVRRKKLKFPIRNSDLSEENGDDLISIKSGRVVSPGRFLGASHDDPTDRAKWVSKSRELVPSCQSIDSKTCDGTASSSYGGQPSPIFVSGNEMSSIDNMNAINCNMKGDTSRIGQGFNNSSGVYCDALQESFLDEVSVENNVSSEINYSSSDFGASLVSDSSVDFHLLRDNIHQEATPQDLEWEQIRQDENLLHVDMVSTSNTLPVSSAEISSHETRRSSRRLFWDAFSRRSSRRLADSRRFLFSSSGSDHLRSPDRQLLSFSGGFIDDEFVGDLDSRGSRSPGANDHYLNPRLELWDSHGGTLDSTDYPPPACPRGVHANGSCLCQTSSLAEESGPRTGISRIVMLAEALFEVLDQIHQQPLSLSLSVASLPAPESVVDSFLVKTHGKSENLESADDVSQCYICLAEYEEGDKIRVLPCHHECHVSCVDKWLKEIHGVCPLCRGDVSLGSSEG
ncbi:uncharacterized protein LOC121807148 isoform X2 [Salvia splendens]|uniref:uncharacterized protein LOC121807148 isoform X2 n=1 Tax=Salvia splendens TaxID=180675 RepID=UPI001C25C10A|nr:uncharacterized protein LOC121807148 isoform X2 [Salvia splendens]